MIRTLSLSLATLALAASLALAEPGVSVRLVDGTAVVSLEGSWPGWSYNAFKLGADGQTLQPLLSESVLCIGACSVPDPDVEPGATYSYRFDLYAGDGSVRSYGPYAVTIPGQRVERVAARLTPNPSRGAVTIELRLAGRATDPAASVDAAIYDLQGRRLRSLFRGALPRGLTRLAWDGRDDRGVPLETGTFFLSVRTPLGNTLA